LTLRVSNEGEDPVTEQQLLRMAIQTRALIEQHSLPLDR